MATQYPPPAEHAALHRRLSWYRPVAVVVAAVLGCVLVGLVLMKLGVL